MSIIQILFLFAIAGHLLCGYCDCLLTYVPGGKKFGAKQLKDNVLMSKTFEKCHSKILCCRCFLDVWLYLCVLLGIMGYTFG